MPIQEYNCIKDGVFEIYQTFQEVVLPDLSCPTCGDKSLRVIQRLAGVKLKGTWNDNANEMQRDPYTQAKYQSENMYNEQKDMGLEVQKPTEQSIQIAARTIASEKNVVKPSYEKRALAVHKRFKKAQKKKKE